MSMNSSMSKVVYKIDFAAPSALNTDTLGVEVESSLSAFTPRAPNVITDIRHTVDPASTKQFTLYTRRVDTRKVLGYTPDFVTTNIRPASTIGASGLVLNAGLFQFVERQTLGALSAQSYLITLQRKLNV